MVYSVMQYMLIYAHKKSRVFSVLIFTN